MKQILVAALAGLSLVVCPTLAAAQNISVSQSTDPALPFTLIFPEPMQASGSAAQGMRINHPDAPLQCEMNVVPVVNTEWTAQTALGMLDDNELSNAWSAALPGFSVTDKGTTAYQDATALFYEGESLGSELGIPLTLVHTETVAGGLGYVLDCFYATAEAARARPIVDFIIANFATSAEAECCRVELPAPEAEAAPAQ